MAVISAIVVLGLIASAIFQSGRASMTLAGVGDTKEVVLEQLKGTNYTWTTYREHPAIVIKTRDGFTMPVFDKAATHEIAFIFANQKHISDDVVRKLQDSYQKKWVVQQNHPRTWATEDLQLAMMVDSTSFGEQLTIGNHEGMRFSIESTDGFDPKTAIPKEEFDAQHAKLEKLIDHENQIRPTNPEIPTVIILSVLGVIGVLAKRRWLKMGAWICLTILVAIEVTTDSPRQREIFRVELAYAAIIPVACLLWRYVVRQIRNREKFTLT